MAGVSYGEAAGDTKGREMRIAAEMEREELERELARLHPESFRWALCCAREYGEAQDVLQTAYLKVLDGRARFEGRSSFKTWLFAVIRRTASERRRGWWRRLVRMQGDFGIETAGLADPAPGPLADAETAQSVDRLRAALRKLPRRQRAMLDLVFSHEMTVAEASATLGISSGAGRVHYHRGKRRLRAQLSGEGVR